MAISEIRRGVRSGGIRRMIGGPARHRANLRGLGLTPAEVERAMADLFGPAKPAPAPVVVPPPPPPKPPPPPVVVAPVFVPPPPPRPVAPPPPPPSKLNWLAVAASAGAGFVAGGPPGALVGAGAGFWIGRPK
jgi:hypothetical protein